MSKCQVTIVVEDEKFLPIVKAVLADAVRDVKVEWHAPDYTAFPHPANAPFDFPAMRKA